MSTLIVEELFDGVTFTQPIRIDRDISIACIRPWVYINGTLATGDLQCRVLQGATVLKTVTVNFADINAAITEDYAHGYLRMDIESLILNNAEGQAETDYILEFSMINYTNDANNYLGIVREWDQQSATVYGDVDGSGDPVNGSVAPIGYQIFEYRSF